MTDQKLRLEIEKLREFDTALLANTLGYIDPTPAHEFYMGGSIRSMTPTLGPTVGVAVTCCIDSSSPGQEPAFDDYWEQLEQIRLMKVPVIWVAKCIGSRPDHECVLGDGMGKMLASVGCVGVVTDGGVRDIDGLLTVPMATYAKGITIHHTSLRFSRINEPVEIGGITVNTGDVLHANAEGVIKLPKEKLEALGPKAVHMRAFEYQAHQILRDPEISPSLKKKQVQQVLLKCGF